MKFIIHFESSFLTVSSRINHPIKSYAHKTQPDLEHILTIYESQRPRISLRSSPGHPRGWRSGYWVCIDIGRVDGSMFSNFLDAYKVVMIINVSKSRKYETRFTHVIGYVH